MSQPNPVLFIGHGNPMNAIEDNEFSRAWIDIGKSLSPPDAIVCISAHWQTEGSKLTGSENPPQIYDFYGFPESLQRFKYSVKGSLNTATQAIKYLMPEFQATLDIGWGIDHGAWSVLSRLFPQGNVPVIQLSLDQNLTPAKHWQLAQKLQTLRRENVLIVASGNMVHNLREVEWQSSGFDWAVAFDANLKKLIESGNHEALINYEQLEHWQHAIPTNEHYLPLLYALALKEKGERVKFATEKVIMGSISMRSFII